MKIWLIYIRVFWYESLIFNLSFRELWIWTFCLRRLPHIRRRDFGLMRWSVGPSVCVTPMESINVAATILSFQSQREQIRILFRGCSSDKLLSSSVLILLSLPLRRRTLLSLCPSILCAISKSEKKVGELFKLLGFAGDAAEVKGQLGLRGRLSHSKTH